jgi:hypothetical protein
MHDLPNEVVISQTSVLPASVAYDRFARTFKRRSVR